jgi:hypothetical protein
LGTFVAWREALENFFTLTTSVKKILENFINNYRKAVFPKFKPLSGVYLVQNHQVDVGNLTKPNEFSKAMGRRNAVSTNTLVGGRFLRSRFWRWILGGCSNMWRFVLLPFGWKGNFFDSPKTQQ